MRKTLQIHAITLLLTVTLLTNGCKKEGPAGPAGNANVTARTFSASSWAWSSPYYYANFSMPEINSTNINSAAIMVYFRANSGNWSALPYTQYNSPYNYYMGFNTSNGNVQVTWVYDTSFSSGDDPNVFYSITVQYKIVVIPPAERLANPNVNLLDYNAVKAAYHLED